MSSLFGGSFFTKVAKPLFIKGAKPVGAAVVSCATYYAYQEWQKAGEVLQITDNKQQMERLFDRIDTGSSGRINSRELKTALEKAGMNVGAIKLKAMIYAVDENSDGKINREEWRNLVDKILDDRTQNSNKAPEKLKRVKSQEIYRYEKD